MADFLDIAKKIAGFALPAVANALVPGSGALAQQVINVALGVTGEQTPDAASAALEAHPELQIQLREKLLEHEEIMATIGRQAAQDERQGTLDTFRAEVSDRDSARHREMEVKDKTPATLAYLVFAEVALCLLGLFFLEVPASNANVLYLAVGAILGAQATCFSYYYGTTQHSETKNATIVDLAKQQVPVK